MDYTVAQRAAIGTRDQNLQIIACAGSGKTQVISARIVGILKAEAANGVGPGNIVAFTFTEKAAAELKDRIHRLCQEELGTDQGLAEMFVGTIHAYCLNLLQSAPVYKYLKYSVLTDIQQRLLIDRNSRKSGLTDVPLLAGGHLKRWIDSRLYQQLLGILGEGDVDRSRVPEEVLAAVEKYHRLRASKRYFDFTSIVSEAVAEIEANAALREKLRSQIRYLVVDEYQDVNPLQERLVRHLHELGANVCVVGDDDQTIYQWRGSDVGNIVGFADRYPDVAQVALNENFRSSQGIVVAARTVVEHNPARLPKRMESTDAQPYRAGNILARELSDVDDEAAWIVGKIQDLHGTEYQDRAGSPSRGLTYADFAVLLRSVKRDAGPILEALEEAGIPYVVGGMNGLFDTLEVGAMRAAFHYLADFALPGEDPLDEERLADIFSGARLGLKPSQIVSGIAFLKERKSLIGKEMDATLYLQRLYLDVLEHLGLREEAIDRVGDGRSGEIVYYNLGKFSQVISDYERINFNSAPINLYARFAEFLYHQAPDYYPEGWKEAASATPDAVQVMTVHQAKGMQWPTVFVPCLRRNRFPSRRQGGRSAWHIIPESCVGNADRYKGTVEDERRLFYVALTRAERYLYCSWAPIPANQQHRRVSDFFRELTDCPFVLTKEPYPVSAPARMTPQPRKAEAALSLTFSELKYFFECPYLFKLRFLYGFDTPVNRALGYGKSLHDALAEIHAEAIKGNVPGVDDVPRLVADHLHLPFASPTVEANLRRAALKALERYLQRHGGDLANLEHVEKVVELKLDEGIVVSGRVDLIRRTDTDQVVIVDFKSDERAQAEHVTQKQLHVYAVGYEQLAGRRADLIEVHNLDRGGATREVVDERLVQSTIPAILDAGRRMRDSNLARLEHWGPKCNSCDLVGVCRPGPPAVAAD